MGKALEERVRTLEEKVNALSEGKVIVMGTRKDRMSVSEYARRIGVDRKAVYGWIDKGLVKTEKDPKFNVVVDWPGKDEGVIRYPTREDFEKAGITRYIVSEGDRRRRQSAS